MRRAAHVPQRRAFAHRPLEQLEIAQDDGKKVVEVVGYAAGQPTHRLDLLRLAQRLLGLTPLGDLLRQLLVGLGELRRPLGDALLQGLVESANLRLGAPAIGHVEDAAEPFAHLTAGVEYRHRASPAVAVLLGRRVPDPAFALVRPAPPPSRRDERCRVGCADSRRDRRRRANPGP